MTVYGFIGLAVIAFGILAVILAVQADARAQRAHERWQDAFSQWLASGMQGPRP